MIKTIITYVIILSFSAFICACSKDKNEGPGSETFYVSAANAVFPVQIQITNSQGTVGIGNVTLLQSTAPDCNNFTQGAAYKFTSNDTDVGYTFSASDNGGHTWQGSFLLYADNCHLYQLTQ